MTSSFFSPIYDALVFGVNESDTRRRFKLLFLMLIYGHCYIVIYRSALAGQVYFDGTNTSPSFWYSVLGAMGAGAVFHLIDEGCSRLTRHDGPSEHRHKSPDTDLEDNASSPASSPLAAINHDPHNKPPPQQPTPSLHNTTIQNPPNDPAPLTSTPPSKPPTSIEIFKSFRISLDAPCHNILPQALRKYNIHHDQQHYDLYILFGDQQERLLEPEEFPLRIFKQLDREGKKPIFMLRRKVLDGSPAIAAGQGSFGQEVGAAVGEEPSLIGGEGKGGEETETSSLFKVD